MNNFPLRESQLFGVLAVAGLCLGGVAAYALLRRRPSPDEQERERREMLVRQGRIIDATVIDISDLNAEESGRPHGMQLILYKYEIAGVVYECSQDVTMLRHLVDIYKCRLGFPASVRYDPHNPTNSLIVAEGWSGLRETANSVAVPQPGDGERKVASPPSDELVEQHAAERPKPEDLTSGAGSPLAETRVSGSMGLPAAVRVRLPPVPVHYSYARAWRRRPEDTADFARFPGGDARLRRVDLSRRRRGSFARAHLRGRTQCFRLARARALLCRRLFPRPSGDGKEDLRVPARRRFGRVSQCAHPDRHCRLDRS